MSNGTNASGRSGGGGGVNTPTPTPAYAGDTEVDLPGGVKLDLSNTPLVYGDNDPSLTQAQRVAIEAWEAKRVTAKVEWGTFLDKDGNQLVEKRGGKGAVSLPARFFYGDENIMSHVHPRDVGSGILGGTFSYADVRNFCNTSHKTTRATAAEGTYSISKTKSFNSKGALSYFSSISRARESEYKTAQRSLNSDFRAGRISRTTYNQQSTNAFNAMLVNLHNDFIAGQSTYGYTYTLERTK